MPKEPRTQADFLPVLIRIHERWANITSSLESKVGRWGYLFSISLAVCVLMFIISGSNEHRMEQQTATWLNHRVAHVSWGGNERIVSLDLSEVRGGLYASLLEAKKLRHVTSLTIDGRRVALEDIQVIGQFQAIQDLVVVHGELAESHVIELLRVSNLRSIRFRNCLVTEESIARLKAAGVTVKMLTEG